jgi:hypothetical protein
MAWTTDKDGPIMNLLAAEITARTGKDPGRSTPMLDKMVAWQLLKSARLRFARDSLLEGDGFELPVPQQIRSCFRGSSPVSHGGLTVSRPGTESSNRRADPGHELLRRLVCPRAWSGPVHRLRYERPHDR